MPKWSPGMELPSNCFSPLDFKWHASSGHAMRVVEAHTRLAPRWWSAWSSFQELHPPTSAPLPTVVRIVWARFNVRRMSKTPRQETSPPSTAATLASCLGIRGAGAAPPGVRGTRASVFSKVKSSTLNHLQLVNPATSRQGGVLGWAPCGQVCDSPSRHPPCCHPLPPFPSSPSGANHMPHLQERKSGCHWPR